MFELIVSCANLTTADTRAEVARFERFTLRPVKLRVLFDSGQPEAKFVEEVVASSTGSVAFNERSSAEVFQARSRAG